MYTSFFNLNLLANICISITLFFIILKPHFQIRKLLNILTLITLINQNQFHKKKLIKKKYFFYYYYFLLIIK